MQQPKQISQDFIVLSPDKQAFVERADASLFQRLDTVYNNFTGHELVSCYEFDADWSSWEMHPYGDEIVMLIYGEVTFILKTDTDDTTMVLTEQGQYVIVPKGIWHTAKTLVKSKLLFITPGQGTQHRANV